MLYGLLPELRCYLLYRPLWEQQTYKNVTFADSGGFAGVVLHFGVVAGGLSLASLAVSTDWLFF